MSYPRSRLFRNYEAQVASQKKSYPRSRLFQVYEQDQEQKQKQEKKQEKENTVVATTTNKSISVQELFRMVKDAEKNTKVQHHSKAVSGWGDDGDEFECDFSTMKLDY
jgi:DNA gyrase/topoisomerase IV subunit A